MTTDRVTACTEFGCQGAVIHARGLCRACYDRRRRAGILPREWNWIYTVTDPAIEAAREWVGTDIPKESR